MPESNAWFDEVNTGPYAAQISKGFGLLGFDKSLEGEYRQFSQRQNFRLRLWCLYFAIVLWPIFSIPDQLLISGGQRWWMLLVRLLVLCVLLSLVRPLKQQSDERTVDRMILGALLLIGTGAALIITLGHSADPSFPYEGLILISFAAYFLAGLRLVQAAAVSLAFMLIYALMELWAGYPPDLLGKNLFFLFAGNLIAAVGGYQLEYKSREHFLNHQLLRQLANHDSLTGLDNRRSFNHKVERRWRQAQRDNVPLVLLLVDVDHFKAFNDCYGHQLGDQALQQLGQVIGHAARRPLDIAVRMGGEEFAVLLYDMSKEQAQAHAEALRMAVLGLSIPHASSPTTKVLSISIGLAFVRPAAAKSIELVYERADKALYHAKAAGRNQVMQWSAMR